MSHDGFNDGPCPPAGCRADQIADLGFGGMSENVLYNMAPLDSTVEEGHQSWMESSGHHANIMNPSNTAVGYGMYVCGNGGSAQMYMTGLYAS